MTSPLRPTVAHLETSLCVCESYIFIFALGDDAEANVEMRVRSLGHWEKAAQSHFLLLGGQF